MGKNLFTDYEGFVEKFVPKKTTDDCYTPEPVYRAVLDYVGTYIDLTGIDIRRPFYPGGDFETEADEYGVSTVVIDNPPFSILSKILRFYHHRKIKFFLFAPALTLFSCRELKGVTYIVTDATITYENGAQVNTSFITNLSPGKRIILAGKLQSAIKAVQKNCKGNKQLVKNLMPINVVTAARLHKAIVPHKDWSIPEDECIPIRTCGNYPLFGGGFLIPTKVGERERERERERDLSTQQRAAVEKLDRMYEEKKSETILTIQKYGKIYEGLYLAPDIGPGSKRGTRAR